MARTHMQRDFAAFETFSTSSGVNPGSSMYFFSCLIVFSLMLSLSKVSRSARNVDSPMSFLASSHVGLTPLRMHTPSSVNITMGGGFANDLISVMSFLLSDLSALSAESKAGRASSRSFWASSLMTEASSVIAVTFLASSSTFACTTAAASLSLVTTSMSSAASTPACASFGCILMISTLSSPTMTLVLFSLSIPFWYRSTFALLMVRSSPSIPV
mmetsp:Transcript_48472/g.115297  ORF Transcript_48472/g.115297 Transcript_48472/m.115297 type:complete len:215 (-) Transcript_48472:231-875(-)